MAVLSIMTLTPGGSQGLCIYLYPIEADARSFAWVVRNMVCGQRDCPDCPAGQHSAQHAARVSHAGHQQLPLVLHKATLGALDRTGVGIV